MTNVTSGKNGKSFLWGALSAAALLGLYFVVLSAVSGLRYAQSQFSDYWYFVVSLAIGFGVQVGLYAYLRSLVKSGTGKILGVTGTTSTAAMISCCTHYLANLLPILGTAGIVTFVSQYQTQFFWVGIAFNLAGIGYMAKKIVEFRTV